MPIGETGNRGKSIFFTFRAERHSQLLVDKYSTGKCDARSNIAGLSHLHTRNNIDTLEKANHIRQ